jgi:hypothetical protein
MIAVRATLSCLACAWGAVAILAAPCLADSDALQLTVVELSTHGSRMPGYAGDRYAADYVQRQFAAAGVQEIQREPFEVTVPVDKGASLELLADGTVLRLWSLWPNLVRTSTVPPAGVEAELIYGGHGRYEEFDGQDVVDRIVLMEFNSAHHWRTPASLGARAILFIEPDETTIAETRKKWSTAPLDMPRFWIDRTAADALKEQLSRGPVRVKLKARMDWEQQTTWNIWGIVPGTDPELRDELVAVEAYYDGTSVVPGLNPSAESAVSIAALIEFAHSLREHPPGRSVALIATGAHFVRKAGIVDFVNRHARDKPLFKARMPRRLNVNRIEAAQVKQLLLEKELSAQALGISFEPDAVGAVQLADIDLPRLTYELTRIGLTTDNLGLYTEPDSLDISLFISLDLSSHSNRVAVWNSDHHLRFQRIFLPLSRSFMGYEQARQERLAEEPRALLLNGISPPKGRLGRSYFSHGEGVSNGAIARGVGILTLELRTVEDPRLRLDSPLDRAQFVDFESLSRQSELINDLLHGAVSDRELYGHDPAGLRAGLEQNIKDEQRTIHGSLRQPASHGGGADEAVPFGIAALAPDRVYGWRPWIAMADRDGDYRISGMPLMTLELYGFLLDPMTGDITHATDRGELAQKIGKIEQSLSKDETAWTTVLFPASSIDLYERIIASRFFTLGGWDTKIIDKRGITPRSYGYSAGDFGDESMVLHGALGDSLRLIDRSVVLLANKAAPAGEEALGVGFSASDRRLIPNVTLQSAKDMWRLDESRLQQLRAFSIENPLVEKLHEAARRLIEQAEEAGRRKQWGQFAKFSREALGIEYRAYPDVKGTQNDVLTGLVFLSPFCCPPCSFSRSSSSPPPKSNASS